MEENMKYKIKINKKGSIRMPQEIMTNYEIQDGDLLSCDFSDKTIILKKMHQ
jgi:uncharacterized ubiquitin-like protein YukD